MLEWFSMAVIPPRGDRREFSCGQADSQLVTGILTDIAPLIAYKWGFRECQFPMPTCGFLVHYPVEPINTNPTFYRWRGSGEVNPLMASETGTKGLATEEEELTEQSCETVPEPSVSVPTVTGTVTKG